MSMLDLKNKKISKHRFYEVMNYPIPNGERFFCKNKSDYISNFSWFLRNFKDPKLFDFLEKIKKYRFLFCNLPFVRDIYICNSLSFNKLTENSDIDLFFVIEDGKMWRARFWSVIIFWLFNIKTKKLEKKWSDNYMKFCLSFYVCESSQNLEKIKKNNDIYLAYRIAHTSPIYQQKWIHHYFTSQNPWIKNFLPNHNLKHNIDFEIWIENKVWIFKKIIEFFLNNKFWNLLQILIKYIRLPIIIRKKSKLWKNAKNIIISDDVLKFYEDKRDIYNKIVNSNSVNYD